MRPSHPARVGTVPFRGELPAPTVFERVSARLLGSGGER